LLLFQLLLFFSLLLDVAIHALPIEVHAGVLLEALGVRDVAIFFFFVVLLLIIVIILGGLTFAFLLIFL
jgi:hypothetical protein